MVLTLKIVLFFTHKYHAAASFIVDALAAVTVPSLKKQRLRLGFFYFDISELFIFRYYNWISFALWKQQGLLRYQTPAFR
jgi:hypothetical protein